MPKNIALSLGGIITICNLFNRLNSNIASRVIKLFEMPIKKIINLGGFFIYDSAQKIYKFGQHIACHNLSLLKIKHK